MSTVDMESPVATHMDTQAQKDFMMGLLTSRNNGRLALALLTGATGALCCMSDRPLDALVTAQNVFAEASAAVRAVDDAVAS